MFTNIYISHFVGYLQTFRYQRFSYFAFTEYCSKLELRAGSNFVQNNEPVLSKILIKTGAS